MTRRVTIASGKSQILLPDGGTYEAGDVVDLTDDQFALIPAKWFPGTIINTGPVEAEVRTYRCTPSAAGAATVHAAVTDNGSSQTITTGITQPDVPRNVSATAGGTAGDIKAIQVIVHGTNADDEVISETLPAFTVNTAGIVVGDKAFKTITSYVIPAHDGTGATTALGRGSKLGLPRKLTRNTVLAAYLNGALEGTAPTVTVDDNELEKNTVLLNSSLDGNAVVIDYYDS